MSGKGGWKPGVGAPVDGGLVSSAKATILTCGVLCGIVVAVGIVRHVGAVDPSTGKRAPSGAARPVMGLTVAVVMLLLLSQKAPRLAAQFATLMTVTILLSRGPEAFGSINRAIGSEPPGVVGKRVGNIAQKTTGGAVGMGAAAGARIGAQPNP